MNLAQYMAQRRNGTYLSTMPRPVMVVAPVVVMKAPEVANYVIAPRADREPVRLPAFDTAARCFRKCFESHGKRGRKPRYKAVRRGGLRHRKHPR